MAQSLTGLWGTFPFMSKALIQAWASKRFYYTAVNDLESFVWVLLWSVLDILQLRKALNNEDER